MTHKVVEDALPAWVRPGASYSYLGRRFHIRGLVDGHVVLREWWPSKRRWNYTIEHPVYFEIGQVDMIKRKLRGALI